MTNIHEEGGKRRMVQEVSTRYKEVNRGKETKQVEDLRTVLQSFDKREGRRFQKSPIWMNVLSKFPKNGQIQESEWKNNFVVSFKRRFLAYQIVHLL